MNPIDKFAIRSYTVFGLEEVLQASVFDIVDQDISDPPRKRPAAAEARNERIMARLRPVLTSFTNFLYMGLFLSFGKNMSALLTYLFATLRAS